MGKRISRAHRLIDFYSERMIQTSAAGAWLIQVAVCKISFLSKIAGQKNNAGGTQAYIDI